MNSSLRLGQSTVTCINTSSGASKHGDNNIVSSSFPLKRVSPGVRIAAKKQFLGSKIQGSNVGVQRVFGASNGSKWNAGTWLDNKASVDADISIAEAWELWSDREKIPQWMKWIDKVTVSKQKPDFSKWTLRYHAFGRDFEFSWLARNMKPVHHQKIHWRSVDGLPNRGEVRFYPRGKNACRIELKISYELPDIMAPLGSAVGPIVERVMTNDLNRFAKMFKSKQLSRV